MKRIDLMQAQVLSDGSYRLNHHTAKYCALNRKDFSVGQYTITLAEAHRPDLVALKCYGKPEWWYVLAWYNGIINPLAELVVGLTLYVPNYHEVDKLFKQGQTTAKQGQRVEV